MGATGWLAAAGVAGILLAAPGSAAALQDVPGAEVSLADLDLEQLGNVRVTSVSRTPEAVGRAAAAVFVVSADDIRRSGATSVPEALRLAPGLQVVRLGSQNWSITSRGFADFTTNKLLVLIDGRAIYSPLFAGVFWDAQLLPIDDVERIEVILGPGATLWGSNAVNGVINVVTRPATSTRGGLVAARAGTWQRVNASARYGVPLGARGALRVHGAFVDRDPSEGDDGSDLEDAWQGGQAGARMDLDLTPRDALTVQGDAYVTATEQVVREALPDPPFARQARGRVDLAGANLLARWTRRIGEASELQVQTYVDHSIRDQQPATGRVAVTLADLELQHRTAFGRRHAVVWGAGVRVVDGELRGTFTTMLDPPQRTTTLVTVYAQDEIVLAPGRWTVTPGLKVERNDFSGVELQPSLRGRWTPDARQTVWAAASRAVRIPSRLDTDLRFIAGAAPTTPPTYIRFDGNEAFDSEELISAELGYRVDLARELAVDVSAYYGWYDRLRSVTPQAPAVEDGQPVQSILITNGARGHTAGGTLAVTWRPVPRLLVRGSYTRLDMDVELRDDAAPGTTPNVDPGVNPEQQATLTAFATLPHGVELGAVGRYTGILRGPGVPEYVDAEVRLGWTMRPGLSIALVGRSLLRERHREFVGPARIPRRAELHATWWF